MTLDLVFNIILTVFFGYCLWDIGSLSELPGSDIMGAAMWPRIILVLLVAMLLLNIYHIAKKNKANAATIVRVDGAMIMDFFKSKLFVGIVIVFAMALVMDPLGFIPTSFLFLMAYGFLLGQRNYIKLALFSIVITFALFFIFSKGLAIMLPRGYGVLREFALALENI